VTQLVDVGQIPPRQAHGEYSPTPSDGFTGLSAARYPGSAATRRWPVPSAYRCTSHRHRGGRLDLRPEIRRGGLLALQDGQHPGIDDSLVHTVGVREARCAITLHPEEPPAGPWRVERIPDVFAQLAGRAEMAAGPRPLSIAIDGRSSSRKTTLAERIAEAIPATAVVHTDDIAWFHSRFGWADFAGRVLETAHLSEPLSFRPWDERRPAAGEPLDGHRAGGRAGGGLRPRRAAQPAGAAEPPYFRHLVLALACAGGVVAVVRGVL
jgi:hypothetical protein